MYKKLLIFFVLALSLAYDSYGDTVAPKPNQMSWRYVPAATGPYTITMTATTALDANDPPVQYLFTCTSDGTKSSGWQSSPTYEASGLNPKTTYIFNVRAKDDAGNTNVASYSLPATTDDNSTPPVLRLDLNNTTDNNDANTQTGFLPFILANSGTEINGVTIDLGGDITSARREDPCGAWSKYGPLSWPLPGDPCYYSPRAGERIYRDFVYGRQPSGVGITLWGLGVYRDCNIMLWAYDAGSTGDVNRVAEWYANGVHIFDTNFIGGPNSWPRYDNFSPTSYLDLYKYAFKGRATTDNFGRIALTSTMSPSSPVDKDFAFVNAIKVEPNSLQAFVPTPYAHRPQPVDGGVQCVPVNTLLKWRNGSGVSTHDLYLGTNFNDVNTATRASHPNVLVCQLDLDSDANKGVYPFGTATRFLVLDTTYYWKVDENDNPPIYKGEVWNFTTCPNSVADNFNSYISNADLRNVWKDYWTQSPPQTSAEVFLEWGDDANLVRDGHSMRYLFENYSYEPYYSEVRATIGSGAGKLNIDPNWDAMGAKSLSLWFYGQAGNDANYPMYVRLTDGDATPHAAKVAYNGDMNDIREQTWLEWNINLQEFVDNNNVNLANVKTITIGFGDGTQAASDGTVYFEDIQLTVGPNPKAATFYADDTEPNQTTFINRSASKEVILVRSLLSNEFCIVPPKERATVCSNGMVYGSIAFPMFPAQVKASKTAVKYKVTKVKNVEMSADGGQTWTDIEVGDTLQTCMWYRRKSYDSSMEVENKKTGAKLGMGEIDYICILVSHHVPNDPRFENVNKFANFVNFNYAPIDANGDRVTVSDTSLFNPENYQTGLRTAWGEAVIPQRCDAGYIPDGDLTYDCEVNWYDIKVISEEWLTGGITADIYPNGSPDGIVDFRDFAVLADDWLEGG